MCPHSEHHKIQPHRNRKLWVEGGLEGAGSEAAECWAHQSWAAGNHGRPAIIISLLLVITDISQPGLSTAIWARCPAAATGDDWRQIRLAARCPMVAATVTTSAPCSGFIAKMLPPHPQQKQFSYLNFSINNLE